MGFFKDLGKKIGAGVKKIGNLPGKVLRDLGSNVGKTAGSLIQNVLGATGRGLTGGGGNVESLIGNTIGSIGDSVKRTGLSDAIGNSGFGNQFFGVDETPYPHDAPDFILNDKRKPWYLRWITYFIGGPILIIAIILIWKKNRY